MICRVCNIEKKQIFFRPQRRVCKSCCLKNDCKKAKKRFDSDDTLREKRSIYLKQYRRKKKLDDPFYYQKENKKKYEYRKLYEKNRVKNDIEYRILKNLRCRVYSSVKGLKKYNTKKLTGLSIPDLKMYLASKFKDGMSWDNYGKWHIDHIRPCASFDLSILENQIECFHYTNLQPLWAIDNIKKGCKM